MIQNQFSGMPSFPTWQNRPIMRRSLAAFFIAPAAVPVLVGCICVVFLIADSFSRVHNPMIEPSLFIEATTVSAAFSYALMVLFGIPGYLWLRKRQINAFWASPALGVGIGATTASTLVLLFSDPQIEMTQHPDAFLSAIVGIVSLASVFGALVGAAHRLITGPTVRDNAPSDATSIGIVHKTR